MSGRRVVGRSELVATIWAHLGTGGGVVLTGPGGIGKTTVLDLLAAAAGRPVLRATGVEADRWIGGGVLADLFAQVPAPVLDRLPADLRDLDTPVRRRRAWEAVLTLMRPLVLLDDVQWVDAASAEALATAVRRARPGDAWVVVAGRCAEGPRPVAPALLVPRPPLRVSVPPLRAADLAELFDAYGLPARAAQVIHADSAGNPYLALTLAGAFGDRHGEWGPQPLPPAVAEHVHEALGGLSTSARETLLLCALASGPSVTLLERAGRVDARRDVAEAVAAGLVVTDSENVRFTPPAAATLVADLVPAERRAGAHRVLADAATFPDQRERHLALASADPDARVARSLVTAAEAAVRRGARDLAAELFLLAADRTPADRQAGRLQWLVAAAEAGADAGLEELARRAAAQVLAADAPGSHRVRARMALVQLAGQGVGDMAEVFAAALVDAGDDPGALAPLRLWRAWAAMISARPGEAAEEAGRAVEHARRVGDTATEALALTVIALMRRLMGRDDHMAPLEAALALPPPHLDGRLHLSPRFALARFALLDDRLARAHEELLGLLALVERGTAEELVSVLRNLVDVTARMGRCRDALDYADRAARVGGAARLSPGPGWHACAVAELAGGRLDRARAYAERGVAASEQEGDNVFLRRHLHALGQTHLRSGRPAEAVAALGRIPALEGAIDEPANLRWHADLVTALVETGAPDEARALLARTRARLGATAGGEGVSAQLDRAEATLVAAQGDPGSALPLLDGATTAFVRLGQPLEAGHCLLVRARVERRARRYAAARESVDHATTLFAAAGAKPWLEQAARLLGHDPGQEAAPAAAPELTDTEGRVATLAAEGATNREIADLLYLSVKTVEATLTRVYRKLGVRSRTQLSRVLHPG